VLVANPGGIGQTLIWHDLRSGRQRVLTRNVLRFVLSPDGRRLVYVGGMDFSDGWPPHGHERLGEVDLPTGKRSQSAVAPAGASFGVPNRTDSFYGSNKDAVVRWSPDGRNIAYLTGSNIYHRALWPAKVHDSDFQAPPQHYTLWVREPTTGEL